MLKFGYITEINADEGTVRVNFIDDEIVSNPLPVSMPSTKKDKYHFPFAINEQVWCLMDSHCEFGVVGGAIYSTKDLPPDGSSEGNIKISINKQLNILIDRSNGNISIDSKGKVEIKTAQGVTVNCLNTNVIGNLTVTGNVAAASFAGIGGAAAVASSGLSTDQDITAGGVSLKEHKHIGGGSGNSTSGPQ